MFLLLDGSDRLYCRFRRDFDVFVAHVEPEGCTVKRCRVSKYADPTPRTDEVWPHPRVTLKSINPGYKSWDVASSGEIRALGEFLFVV